MSEYETELLPTALGLWSYRLFLDGEKVTAFPYSLKMYPSRDAAIVAAEREAQAHRELRLPRRIPINLD